MKWQTKIGDKRWKERGKMSRFNGILTKLNVNRGVWQRRRCSSSPSGCYDIVIVGGGIIGTATAREVLTKHPRLRVAVVEKECELACHQSGHNSGVIHAGIYYKPGSLKAKLCVRGMHLTYDYLDKNNIPYKKCGKLIVACDEVEVKRLMDLHQRGIKNEVKGLQLLDGEKIKDVEPNCTGLKALWSPETGIVDYVLVTKCYGNDVQKAGGEIRLNFWVDGFKEGPNPEYPVLITAKNGQIVQTKYALACGGLFSDKLAEMTGCSKSPRIIPFRGEYLLLDEKKCDMIKGNIYPVPDPRFPFLGVHFTPRMDGSVWLGPNAILAFKREGYHWMDVNLVELADALTYPGFRKLAFKYLGAGLNELSRSFVTSLEVKRLQKFVPGLKREDIRSGPSGVRAQALDEDGNLVDDFCFDHGTGDLGLRVLHCRNAPSPGATSSLAIAEMMVEKMRGEFQLQW